MKFISLFAGIGGLDLGLERAGMECVAQVEIDDFCQRVLQKHWPDVPKFKDVRDVGKHNLPKADAIVGGFPCQPHSAAGKRRGADDDRNLWPEYRRIIDELRPRWVIGENVVGIRTTILDQVLSDLERLDYSTVTFDLPAAGFNAPHIRERIFVVAHTKGSAGYIPTSAWQQEKELHPGGTGANGDVADANGSRLSIATRAELGSVQGQIETLSRGSVGGRNPASQQWRGWPIEPAICGVDDGIPAELDLLGGLNEQGNSQKTDTEIDRLEWTILRTMWEQRKLAETSPVIYARRLRDCLPEMSHRDTHERWYLGAWIETNKGLCNLWQAFYSKPFEESYNLQQELLERIRKVERTKEVGPMKDRVNRLKSLGNAVVPQVAEFIGRAIVGIDHRHP